MCPSLERNGFKRQALAWRDAATQCWTGTTSGLRGRPAAQPGAQIIVHPEDPFQPELRSRRDHRPNRYGSVN
jgi:hypothetical protein